MYDCIPEDGEEFFTDENGTCWFRPEAGVFPGLVRGMVPGRVVSLHFRAWDNQFGVEPYRVSLDSVKHHASLIGRAHRYGHLLGYSLARFAAAWTEGLPGRFRCCRSVEVACNGDQCDTIVTYSVVRHVGRV